MPDLMDLHAHSSESDGSLSPKELVEHAAAVGVKALVLTDHDTTDGLKEFFAAAGDKGIEAFGGVEISAEWKKGNCHILGYGVADDYEPLEAMLRKTRDSRDKRNEMIVAKLDELGVGFDLSEAAELAGGDVVGRPHIARVMMKKGYVGSVQEAFDKYLAKGAPAYIDRFRLPPREAVTLLREAGATVILAHPSQLKRSIREIEDMVGELVALGLAGLEVYTPYADDEQVAEFERIVRTHGLGATGGSDFHGESKPAHKLGYYREGVAIPARCAEVLKRGK